MRTMAVFAAVFSRKTRTKSAAGQNRSELNFLRRRATNSEDRLAGRPAAHMGIAMKDRNSRGSGRNIRRACSVVQGFSAILASIFFAVLGGVYLLVQRPAAAQQPGQIQLAPGGGAFVQWGRRGIPN